MLFKVAKSNQIFIGAESKLSHRAQKKRTLKLDKREANYKFARMCHQPACRMSQSMAFLAERLGKESSKIKESAQAFIIRNKS